MPRSLGHRDRRTKLSSLAAAFLVFYLVLLFAFQRVHYFPRSDDDNSQRQLLDEFKKPFIRNFENGDDGLASQKALGLEKNRIVSGQKSDTTRTSQQKVIHLKIGDANPKDTSNDSREKLRVKLERTKNRQLPLWELSDFAPTWMKEYFEWHQKKRQTLTEELWHQWKKNTTTTRMLDASAAGTKFLVVQCMPNHNSDQVSCGNLMERLGLLPYWLRLAHETNRVLFLHWTVPTDLSEYLEPPTGGCDWRTPMWLQQLVRRVRCDCRSMYSRI